MAKFTQNAVWADTLRLTRAHWGALIAIAGVFNFLPTLLLNYFFPMREASAGADLQERLQVWLDYYRHTSLPITVHGFIVMIGSAAMLRLVFARGGTVGSALVFAIMLLPVYSILEFIKYAGIGVGFVLLVVPGLYLWGRLLPVEAVMIAEDRRNPLDALKRAFALTEGHAWLSVSLYLLVFICGGVLMGVLSQLSGIAFIAAAGRELGALLATIVLCAAEAVVMTLLTMLTAALYRALAPQKPEL